MEAPRFDFRAAVYSGGASRLQRCSYAGILLFMKRARTSRILSRHGLKLVRENTPDGVYEYYPIGRYVVMAPGVCGGRPTFRGTRVEVQTILDWLGSGRPIGDILKGYPSLSKAAVEEAVKLAAQALAGRYSLAA